ncbi:MAG TPA: hypothetical protein VFO69_10945 [Allosphingosinicella sp.]|nr:hypothetical protein [Allosphingosinicella sp.]
MRKLMLLAGVAALSVSLPVVAKENQGRGKGGGGQPAAERSQGGQGNAQRGRGGGGGNDNVQRARGRDDSPRIASRGGGNDRGNQERSARDRNDDRRSAVRAARSNDRVDRQADRDERRVERAIRDERRVVREAREVRGNRQDVRDARRSESRDWRDWSERRLVAADRFRDDLRVWRGDSRPGIRADGCPPGLAKQNALCMPPGQYRKAQFIGQRSPISSWAYNVPDRYSYRFVDNDDWFYRYDDEGYVYRFDRDSGLVNSIVPLFGSDLLIGEPLPLGYEVYNLPMAYRSYYPDSSDYMYRYDDSAIYRVNNDSGLIEGIVALLTGGVGGLGGLGIGDTLPRGYDAYNLPMDYRDQYVDSDDAWYRYADSSIYQVDPQTRLIQEVISLIL